VVTVWIWSGCEVDAWPIPRAACPLSAPDMAPTFAHVAA